MKQQLHHKVKWLLDPSFLDINVMHYYNFFLIFVIFLEACRSIYVSTALMPWGP